MLVKIYLFFLILNVALGTVAQFQPTLGFDTEPNPLFYNRNDPNNRQYAVGNITNPTNSTGHYFDWLEEFNERILFGGQTVIKFITFGFIFDTMDNFATSIGVTYPTEFMNGMVAVIGFIAFLWLIYIIIGRSTSGFTILIPTIISIYLLNSIQLTTNPLLT
jgi:hypothetical protein